MKMRRKYAAFDLETGAEIPEEDEWRDHRPLGITCAALYAPELGDPIRWYSVDGTGEIADRMSRPDLQLMVRTLQSLQEEQGFTLVTWNGMGFDFDVLAEESGLHEECAQLALNHIDMMFQVFCKKGHPLGLDAAAHGMGLAGKTEGMSGMQAVSMWREGEREDVLDYCAQDTRCTHEVAVAGEEARSIKWISRAGKHQSVPLRVGWLTVRQAMKLPLPDTGWMGEALPRESFTQWLENPEEGRKDPA